MKTAFKAAGIGLGLVQLHFAGGAVKGVRVSRNLTASVSSCMMRNPHTVSQELFANNASQTRRHQPSLDL